MKAVIQHVPGKRHMTMAGLLEAFPDAQVINCDGRPMTTFYRCLLAAGETASLMFEDDVTLCRGFKEKVSAVVEDNPGRLITFFSLRTMGVEGLTELPGSSYLMNQCYYLPPGMAAGIAEYLKTWPRIKEHPTGFDLVIRDYLVHTKTKYLLHEPSLVQHDMVRSELGKRATRRQSPTFRYDQ